MKSKPLKKRVVLAHIAPVLSVVTVGLLFLSLVITNHTPQSTLMGKVKYLSSRADSQLLVAFPNPIKVCDGSGVGDTTLSWNVPASTWYELHKGSQTGEVVVQGLGSGSEQVTRVANNAKYVLVGANSVAAQKKSQLGQVYVVHTRDGCAR